MLAGNGNYFRKRSVILVVLTLVAVSLLIGGAVAADRPADGMHTSDEANGSNVFVNPVFDGSLTGWTVDGCGAQASTTGGTTAESSYALSYVGSKSTSDAGWVTISQTVDLTYVDTVTFDIALSSYQSIGYGINFGDVRIGGSPVYFTIDGGTTTYNKLNTANIFGRYPTTGTYHTIYIDTTSYSGRYEFTVFYQVYAVTNENGEFFDEYGNTAENGDFTILGIKSTMFYGLNPNELPKLTNVYAQLKQNGESPADYMINTDSMYYTTVNVFAEYTIGYPEATYIGYTVDTYDPDNATWIQAFSSPFSFEVNPPNGYSTYYVYAKNSYGKAVNYFTFSVEKYGISATAKDSVYNSPPVKTTEGSYVNLFTTGDTTHIYADNSSTPVWYVSNEYGSWTPVGYGTASLNWAVTGSSIYDIKIEGKTTNGRIFSAEYADAINSVAAYVKFNQTSYTTSDTATITWDMGAEYTTGHTYALRIYTCDDTAGEPVGTMLAEKTSISSSGSYSVSCSAFVSGYVVAYIEDITSTRTQIIHSVGVPVTVIGNLQFTITNESATWTTATTVTLYESDGTTPVTGIYPSNPITNITTGTCTFTNVTSPAQYVVKAVTEGYSLTYKLLFSISAGGLTETIPLDFTNGGGTSETVGGSGSMYASTYVTFRIIDEGTGDYLKGVSVVATAVEATNPIDWIANLFGSAWGTKIKETTLKGVTDDAGKITFAMFPVYRYKLEITATTPSGDIKNFEYSFQPTTLTTEEIISLPITSGISEETASQLVITTVTPDDSTGKVTINYADSSGTDGAGTTEKVVIRAYTYDNGEKKVYVLDDESPDGSVTVSSEQIFTREFQLTNYERKEFWFDIECYVGYFYKTIDHTQPSVTRSYGVSFSGMRIKIGNIPDGMYLVISFGILVMLGAIGTQVTSRFYAIIVAAVGLFLLWAGWMSALGTVGTVACVLAFVLAILYYIAGGNQPQ